MKLAELFAGSPAGCVGADDLLIDRRGMLWVRGDAEIFDGEPDPDHPCRIRRTGTMALDFETATFRPASVLEVPQEVIKKRPPRISSQNPPPGWYPVIRWRPWEQRR